MTVWLILAAAVDLFWAVKLARIAVSSRRFPHLADFPEAGRARVSIIVPARNEEIELPRAIAALRAITYPGVEFILIDDRSDDRTGALLDEAARADPRIRTLHVRELPPGWLGKPHAMWQGALEASGAWLLFTDADVLFHPDAIGRAVGCATQLDVDHLVAVPAVETHTIGEAAMVTFFILLFSLTYNIWRTAEASTRDYAGFGAFNMIRRSVYEAIGTYERLRLEVLDDMKLGRLVKFGGFRTAVAFSDGRVCLRWARGGWGVVQNLTKNAFAALRYSLARVAGLLVAGAVTMIYPYVALVACGGWTRALAALAVAAITSWYLAAWRRTRIPPWAAILHPLLALAFGYIVLRSTWLTLRRGGVEWRGTFYRLADLRRGLI